MKKNKFISSNSTVSKRPSKDGLSLTGLTNKVKASLKKHRLITKNETILVALSGGPDSVALLYLLNSLKKEFALKIAAAHLNHMLRGKESKKDMLFCQTLSARLNIPFFSESINIKKLNNNASIEETARKARQDFLFKVTDNIKAAKIALGHTKDDQAETVLMRLLRGSGLYGLSAILPKRKIRQYTLIRPLLEIPKKEILTYLKKRKISYRLDRTNKKDIYFRNRIRRNLIPKLKKYNKNIVSILANTAQTVALDYEYIKSEAEKSLAKIHKANSKSQISLKTDKILRLHPAVRRMVLRLAIQKITGNLRRLSFKHIQELDDLIDARKEKSIVDLPHNISAIKTPSTIKIYRRKQL